MTVNNLHYVHLERSILSITSCKHVYNHDKIERKNMCHDYNRQIQEIVSNVATTRATESFSVKNKARVRCEKILFGTKMPCSTVTLYIVPIFNMQNMKSLGTNVINLQFNDFLSLRNVNIVHYFYLAHSIVSI
jgi:hypothetical protein